MEVWEKVLLSGPGADAFFASVHGQKACTDCHLGASGKLTKEQAHEGLVTRPSNDPDGVCKECHAFEMSRLPNSLHGGLWGEKNIVAARHGVASFDDLSAEVKAGYAKDCGKCHTSCGECHVSRPVSVGGGLVAGHLFGPPSMTENCTACHGSRVGMEYRGENEGFGADVHYVPNAKRCDFCHDKQELHGRSTRPENRLHVAKSPTCEECHGSEAGANQYHSTHWGDLSCQSCHSQDYKSCNTCHAGTGLAEPSYMSFKIGKNPVPDQRPYKYVTLRHIPIAPDTYAAWGTATLSNYSVSPTWRYAAPHNIKRWTVRTVVPEGGTCSTACHGSPDDVDGYFLRQADLNVLSPAEAEANSDLIVPDGSPVNW